MAVYELAILYKNSLSDKIDAASKRLDKTLVAGGGRVLSSNIWGKRQLAYPINKQASAIYAFYNLEVDGLALNGLRSQLNINSDVLRYQFYKLSPQALAAAKSDAKKAKTPKKEEEEKKEDGA